MSEQATIFLPDISGYTDFVSRTELDHSSHIINELLEILVSSNTAGFTLSEIEGDAVLFYRKGEPIGIDDLTKQCIEMFEKFHATLKLIERDTLCQCGACQGASNLTLKFIVHYGAIKEIKVANFTKASGIDMIIAHRLLKNAISSSEYVLATQAYFQSLNANATSAGLAWLASSHEYPSIGRMDFQYALLDKIRKSIPEPPPSERPSYTLDHEVIEIDIHAPMEHVYDSLVNLNARILWVPGVRSASGEKPVDRLGTKHRCVFDDATVEIIPRTSERLEDEIHYIEANTIVEAGLRTFLEFTLRRLSEKRTHMELKVGVEEGQILPPQMRQTIFTGFRKACESFKTFCEG